MGDEKINIDEVDPDKAKSIIHSNASIRNSMAHSYISLRKEDNQNNDEKFFPNSKIGLKNIEHNSKLEDIELDKLISRKSSAKSNSINISNSISTNEDENENLNDVKSKSLKKSNIESKYYSKESLRGETKEIESNDAKLDIASSRKSSIKSTNQTSIKNSKTSLVIADGQEGKISNVFKIQKFKSIIFF